MSPGPVEPTETQSESTRTLDDAERRRRVSENALALPRETRFVEGELVAGRYRIVRFLGRGGQGEVYEAEDRNFVNGLRVALKTISIQASAAADAKDRFEKEVLLARQVAHPNVCPTYDLSYTEEPEGLTCFLTMKLLLGETLSARLKRNGALPKEEGLSVVRQVAAALRAAHEARIVHRDLKPGNIMLEGSGAGVKAVVTDFGLARQADSENTIVSSARGSGTPGYIAPEVLQGQPASPASDLYAFGIVVHQILTGKKPDVLNRPPDVVRDEMQSNGVPANWVPQLSGCLSVDPSRRYLAFEEALEALDPDSGKGPSPYRFDEPIEKALSRRTILLGAGTALACAAAGGAWWKWDDLVQPLPLKRFVALLSWPATTDERIKPTLSGVIDAIENALSRAEVFDRNLLVIAPREEMPNSTRPSQLKAIRDSVGANLVLAASGGPASNHFNLSLQVVDPESDRVLRQRQVRSPLNELTSLPAKAVQAAARLLDVNRGVRVDRGQKTETQSPDAYQDLQAAEALMRRPNNTAIGAAIEKYKAAIEADPHYAYAHANLALAYCRWFALKEEPAALDLARGNAEAALSLDPGSVQAHQALAGILGYTGKKEEALREMSKALAADPDNPFTLVWQAQLLRQLSRWAEAEQTYRRVIKERPNLWLTYNELGYLLDQQGRYDEAIQMYRAASLAAPGNALALNNVGGMAVRLGRFSEADILLKRSIALKPNDLAYMNMAIVQLQQGKASSAVASCEKAVDVNPVNDEAWLDLADAYVAAHTSRNKAKEAYERAASEAQRQLLIDPSDGGTWMRLALYRIKSGQVAAAPALLAKAESLAAIDHDSLLYKVRVLELLGRRDDAIATVRTCFKQGTTNFEIEATPDLQSLRQDPRYMPLEQGARPSKVG